MGYNRRRPMGKEYSTDDENAVAMAENFRMPFGKLRGKRLEDIDNGYLQWAAENINSDDQVAAFADLLLRYRKKWGLEI